MGHVDIRRHPFPQEVVRHLLDLVGRHEVALRVGKTGGVDLPEHHPLFVVELLDMDPVLDIRGLARGVEDAVALHQPHKPGLGRHLSVPPYQVALHGLEIT